MGPTGGCERVSDYFSAGWVCAVPYFTSRHLPAGFLARFGQNLDKVVPVHVVQENVVPLVATARDTIHRPPDTRLEAGAAWRSLG
jgi:hypothetical protein